MLTLEEIRDKLRDRNLSKVSRLSGVGYNNLYAIAKGHRKNPTYKILEKLSIYLEQN